MFSLNEYTQQEACWYLIWISYPKTLGHVLCRYFIASFCEKNKFFGECVIKSSEKLWVYIQNYFIGRISGRKWVREKLNSKESVPNRGLMFLFHLFLLETRQYIWTTISIDSFQFLLNFRNYVFTCINTSRIIWNMNAPLQMPQLLVGNWMEHYVHVY